MPTSGSVDADHHYVLIDYLYNHESLPQLNQSYYMEEMVQYPFGPSLAAAYLAKMFYIEPIQAMQLLIFIVVGLVAVLTYLIASELLEEYDVNNEYKQLISLVSPLMVFSVPIYFLEQYLSSYYYSMIFGELLILGTLLTLLKIERGYIQWIYIFLILNIGIIFTYTLYIIIPILALGIWLFFNQKIRKLFNLKTTFLFGILLFGIFFSYSYARLHTAEYIFQNEGATIIPDTSNFNIMFLILVAFGILFYVLKKANIIGIAFIYIIVVFLEFFIVIFLNKFGLIAKYHAYKTIYLQVLLLAPFASISFLRLVNLSNNINVKNKKQFSKIISYGGILILIFISVSIFLAYPVSTQPIITMNDLKISQYVEKYRFENNISNNNITIIAPKIKAYWLSNGLLRMNKYYAVHTYLFKEKTSTFADWLNNKNSSYLIVAIEDITYDLNVEKNIFVKIEHKDGNMLFLRKI